MQRSFFRERGPAVPFRSRDDVTVLGNKQFSSERNQTNYLDTSTSASLNKSIDADQDLLESIQGDSVESDPRPSKHTRNQSFVKYQKAESRESYCPSDDRVIIRGPEEFSDEQGDTFHEKNLRGVHMNHIAPFLNI